MNPIEVLGILWQSSESILIGLELHCQGPRVKSLVGALRSHKLHSMDKKTLISFWKETFLFDFILLLWKRVSRPVSAEPPQPWQCRPAECDEATSSAAGSLFEHPPPLTFMAITTRSRGDTVLSEDIFSGVCL